MLEKYLHRSVFESLKTTEPSGAEAFLGGSLGCTSTGARLSKGVVLMIFSKSIAVKDSGKCWLF